jgi:formylglycine-generating enzyme required for sulfatase activity
MNKTYQVGDDLVIELHPDATPTLTLASKATGAKVLIMLDEVQALVIDLLDAATELTGMVARYESVFVRQGFEPELIHIPAGEFLMGSAPGQDPDAREPEQPQHTLYLPDYYMARTPVTNAQYAAFVGATGHNPPDHWEGRFPPKGKEDHPVCYVSWYDAITYCRWLTKATGEHYRLPSEAEWEKGARGPLTTRPSPRPEPATESARPEGSPKSGSGSGCIYPWGNQWDPERCNTRESVKKDTTPVGAYPQGASPYGLLDMAGNVWEFTISLWGEGGRGPESRYPYDPTDGRENLRANPQVLRVMRGGSFTNDRHDARCAARYWCYPLFRNFFFGFRVVLSPSPPFLPPLPSVLWSESAGR